MGRLILQVFVPGRSRTKGSLKPIHIPGRNGRPCRVSLTEDHKYSEPWKQRIMYEAVRALARNGERPRAYAEAVEIFCFFRFERTLAVTQIVGGGALPGVVIPSHDTPWPTAADIGDEDKFRRNVLDALTQAGVIADDRLSMGGANYKRWCEPGEEPGALVVVVEPETNVRELERLLLAGQRESWEG